MLPQSMMYCCYYYYFDDDDRYLLISKKREIEGVTYLTRVLLAQFRSIQLLLIYRFIFQIICLEI